MVMYEVTYDEGGEIRSEMIEAKSPVEATRFFYERHTEGGKVVLCVVRQ